MSRNIDITLPANGWRPRDYQMPLWSYLEGGGKRAAICWHRRSGKDETLLNWDAVAAFREVGTYWHMLPEASQARKALWDAVNPHTKHRRIDEAFPPELRASTRDHDMFMRFKNGSTFQVVGSDNFDSLVGSPPRGVSFSEYSLSNPSAWAMLRPILLENGGWATFNFTPRGKNHAKKLLDMAKKDSEWFGQTLTALDTGVFKPYQLERELRELIEENGETDGKALFEQEYYCSFDAAIRGAIYADFINEMERQGRIGKVPPSPIHQVCSAWDLGHRDATSIWLWQLVGYQVRILAYYENNNILDLDHYVTWIRDWCKERHLVPGLAILPHDVEHHIIGMPTPRKDQLQRLGLQVVVAPNISRADGIAAGRQLLKTCVMDEEECAEGIDCLRSYHRKYDEERKVLSAEPVHDWSSNAADAYRMLAVSDLQALVAPDSIRRHAARPSTKQRWR